MFTNHCFIFFLGIRCHVACRKNGRPWQRFEKCRLDAMKPPCSSHFFEWMLLHVGISSKILNEQQILFMSRRMLRIHENMAFLFCCFCGCPFPIFSDLLNVWAISYMPQALAELNDEELRGFDKTREDLDTQVHGEFLPELVACRDWTRGTPNSWLKGRNCMENAS